MVEASLSCEIALIWISLDFTDDQSTLVQVMAWCRQATSHYLSQSWPRSLSTNGVTRPQWVKESFFVYLSDNNRKPTKFKLLCMARQAWCWCMSYAKFLMIGLKIPVSSIIFMVFGCVEGGGFVPYFPGYLCIYCIACVTLDVFYPCIGKVNGAFLKSLNKSLISKRWPFRLPFWWASLVFYLGQIKTRLYILGACCNRNGLKCDLDLGTFSRVDWLQDDLDLHVPS